MCKKKKKEKEKHNDQLPSYQKHFKIVSVSSSLASRVDCFPPTPLTHLLSMPSICMYGGSGAAPRVWFFWYSPPALATLVPPWVYSIRVCCHGNSCDATPKKVMLSRDLQQVIMEGGKSTQLFLATDVSK